MFSDAERLFMKGTAVLVAALVLFFGYGIAKESRVSNECLRLGYWKGVWGPFKGSWCGRLENNTQVVFTLEEARKRRVR